MPFEIRNGSRVEGSHTIGTIHDGETCRATGYRDGNGGSPIAVHFVSLWNLGEIKKGVADSGMVPSQALAFSGLN
jgi:hypothetical protein